MATDLSTILGNLKRVYGDYVARQQNLKHRAMDEIAKSLKKYNPGGEGFFGSINDYGNEAGGAQNETESFRTIDNENYQQYKVSPKVIAWPIEFSGLVAKAADQDEEAFVAAVVDALDMAKERMLKDENRQFFGMGTGLLAKPAGAVLAAATSFSVDTTQYLRDNMVVDIFNGSTKTVDSRRIIRVNRQTNQIEFASAIGSNLATTDEIVKENIRDSAPADGKEMMGLRGIVDDGTDLATFENLNVANNPIWRGVRIDAGAANLTSDLLQRLLDDVEVLGGSEPDRLAMHKKQRRKYLDLAVPKKRYMVSDGEDEGFVKLSFNGIELWLDNDCQIDTVYALSSKHLQKYEVAPIAMGGHDGSDQFLRKVNADVFQAYWRHYCNFGSDKRNAHGKLVNLAAPSGLS